MKSIILFFSFFLFHSYHFVLAQNETRQSLVSFITDITPNDFTGSDIEKIQAAIDAAKMSTHQVTISRNNSRASGIWLIDSAILLPDSITVILDNCVIQLSDSSRDNLFRSANIKIGDQQTTWSNNINIIGIGKAVLRGADNPRATGDGARTLVLAPQAGRVSYGSDAGKEGRKQKGDWRNIMILIAYVNGFTLKNVTIENSHAWAVSFERTLNADISDIIFNLPEEQVVNGKVIKVHNRDGIDLRQGCKYFRINNISGNTEDDFIALSNLGTVNPEHRVGDLNSTMVTASGWHGPQDDIEQIVITNIVCKTNTRAVALRAVDSSGVHHIYINGVTATTKNNNLLVGGIGYGKPSLPGMINNIYAMNLVGDGKALILMESPISDCVFMNGIYTGSGSSVISYTIDKTLMRNVKDINLVKVSPE